MVQLAAGLPGRSAEECEALCEQYHTFLTLPYNPSLEAAFIAMVNDVHDAGDGDAVSTSCSALCQNS